MKGQDIKKGFFFIFIAITFWAMLPIALKLSTVFIDPISLTWFRFFIAFVVSLVIQVYTRNLNQFFCLSFKNWFYLIIGSLLLIFNYILFVYCLRYLTPGSAQLNFQTSTFFLALGGCIFFNERIYKLQIACFLTLAFGLFLFVYPQFKINFLSEKNSFVGVMIVQLAVISWVAYVLFQRSLKLVLSPTNFLLFVYILGGIGLVPLTNFSSFHKLSSVEWTIAFFSGVCTFFAYTFFGLANKYLPTTQVSVMISLTPILCFFLTYLIVQKGWWYDQIILDYIDHWQLIGIFIVLFSVVGVQYIPYCFLRNREEKSCNR